MGELGIDGARVAALLGLLAAAWGLGRWLGRRGIDTTGLEALLVGVALGPLGVLQPGGEAHASFRVLVEPLGGLISLALGGLGLRVGLALNLDALRARPKQSVRITNGLAWTTAATVGAAVYGVLWWLRWPWSDAVLTAALLGSIAVLTSPHAVEAAVSARASRGPLSALAAHVARYTEAFAVVLAGLVMIALHRGDAAVGGRTLVAAEWGVVTVAAGVGLGLAFTWFLGRRAHTEDAIAVTLLGLVLMASGLALALNTSALFVALLAGATLANTSPSLRALEDTVARLDRPLGTLVIFFAALVWRWPSGALWWLVVVFVVARLAGRWLGGAMASLAGGERPAPGARLGTALSGMGPLAVALGVNAWQIYGDRGEVAEVILTCAIVGGLASALPGRWLLGNLLADAGEGLAPEAAPPAAPSAPDQGLGRAHAHQPHTPKSEAP